MVIVSERQHELTKHEEVDNFIVKHVLSCTKDDENATVSIICDDTDVFVVLLHF